VEEERIGRAIRHCRYLVETWPDHPLAVQALRLRADLFFAQEQYQFAFEAYQTLIDEYAGLFDYDAVLTQQLECARKLEHKKHTALFGLSSFLRPRDAIPLYEQILVNAPHIQDAPEIQLTIGRIHMRERDFLLAADVFTTLEQQFPQSPFSEQAALERIEAYRLQGEKTPTDLQSLQAELYALDHFLNTYPNSEQTEEIRLRKHTVYNLLAQSRFETAEFYLNHAKDTTAALRTYQSVLEQYPDSEWTEKAEQRILDLRQDTSTP
jgi:tetratricopeptide (TPR) repeat protein